MLLLSLFVCLAVYLHVCKHMRMSVCMHIRMHACMYVCCLFINLSVCLFACLSVFFVYGPTDKAFGTIEPRVYTHTSLSGPSSVVTSSFRPCMHVVL